LIAAKLRGAFAPFFHRWEHQLASVDNNRIVRPFEWGHDWFGDGHDSATSEQMLESARRSVAASDEFYSVDAAPDYELDETGRLTFTSALASPFEINNRVSARVFHAKKPKPVADQPVVIVLPQWNADADGHVGLAQLFTRFNISAVRLTLPYHDVRRPAELERADYIVSSNIGRTIHANRQAVLDARRVVAWLWNQGYRRIGIMGTSLGSCLSMITMAHDERIRAGAFNHVSTYFADPIWRGLSTRHVRAGLEQGVTLDELRELWMPISPWPFIDRIRGRKTLLIYAHYDLTFPTDLSQNFIDEFARRGIGHDLATLPCGHYTTGKAPFKFIDAYHLVKFFVKNL
jgi:hypothetical protein